MKTMTSLDQRVLMAAAVAMLTACEPPKTAAPSLPRVTVALPHTATVTNYDEYPAHLEAVEMVEIRPRVSGFIDSIHFEDGTEVKAGDLLFMIDPRPAQAALAQVKAERQRAETRLDLSRNDLKRAEGLHGTKAISDEEYDTRSKAVPEAEAALNAVKASEAAAQLNLDYCRVTAPIPGRTGRRLVTVGNLVQGGGMMPGTLLATLIRLDPVYCYFEANEAAFIRYRQNGSQPKEGRPAPNAFSCELRLVGEEGYPHLGYVDFFDNQMDSRSGTLRMRGLFANGDRGLVPGMFAKVRVPAGPPVRALLVPAVALGSDQGGKYVSVVNSSNIVEPHPVELAGRHGAFQAVTKGLTPEDRVIINGLMLARPGTKVEIVTPTPPAPPTPSAAAETQAPAKP